MNGKLSTHQWIVIIVALVAFAVTLWPNRPFFLKKAVLFPVELGIIAAVILYPKLKNRRKVPD